MKARFGQILSKLLLLALIGCSGVSAGPPAPLAEIPTNLQIPGSVGVGVDEIQSAPSSMKFFVGPGGEFSEDIAFGGDQAAQQNQFVDEILAPLNTFLIPASANTTTFAVTVDIAGSPFELKLAFADFDYDGDGVNEGCSGHTAALPICMRVWVSNIGTTGGVFQRRLEAVFTAFPTEQNPGAGRLRGTKLNSKDDQGAESPLVQVIYDRILPTDISTEMSVGVGRRGEPGGAPDFAIEGHGLTTQLGPEGHAVKAVFISSNIDFGDGEPSQGQYVGQFREDADFWSGSVNLQNNAESRVFQDQCAQISSGDGVSQNACLNLGIDVDGTAFIPFMNPIDVLLPDNFPQSPPF